MYGLNFWIHFKRGKNARNYPTFRIYCLVMGLRVRLWHFWIHHLKIAYKSHTFWRRGLFLGWIAFLQMMRNSCASLALLLLHFGRSLLGAEFLRTCSSLHLRRNSIRSVVRFAFVKDRKIALSDMAHSLHFLTCWGLSIDRCDIL